MVTDLDPGIFASALGLQPPLALGPPPEVSSVVDSLIPIRILFQLVLSPQSLFH
jgi:hypothetical protein